MAARIEDAGEKIGGARKDWRTRHMSLEDLAGMSIEEKASLIKKDNIWPKPDYEALIRIGMPEIVAAAVKIIRDRLAATPTLKGAPDSAAGAEGYVRMVAAIRDDLLSCRSIQDINGAYRRVQTLLGGENAVRRDPVAMSAWYSVNKGRFSPLQFHSGDQVKAGEMLQAGFPSDMPAWKKGLKFYATGDGRFAAFKAGRPFGTFRTKDEAYEFVRLRMEAASEKKKAGTKPPSMPPVRPHLDMLMREGMTDHRGGMDISPQHFIEAFGFRGIEFGNWVPNDERQSMLNLGYDGMMDLAEILGWNERDMSLGNRLSAAFGARGQGGKGAAHYESGRAVYNFTRYSGAGLQAHEFAHALDHLLGTGTSIVSGSGVPSATGWRHAIGQPTASVLAHRGPVIAGAWDEIITAINSSPLSKADAVMTQNERVEAFVKAIASQERKYDQAVAEERHTTARLTAKDIAVNTERLGNQRKKLEMLLARDEMSDFGRKQTSFKANAVRLSGPDGYEARPNELFARAFESFIFDELEARGAVSQYLVHGVEEDRYADTEEWKGNPYPTGEERQNFRALFSQAVKATIPLMDELREDVPALAAGF